MELIAESKYPLVLNESDDKMTLLSGYPFYSSIDSIYVQGKEESEINLQQITELI